MQLECRTMKELDVLLLNRRIICWGIGNYFQAFLDSCMNNIGNYNIAYLIDSAADIQNTERKIGTKNVPIIPFSEYLLHRSKNDLVVITTVHYKEIISQIVSSSELIDFVSYALIRHEHEGFTGKIRRDTVLQIPAKIHYCWFGRGEIPHKDREYIEGWKKICPDYEFICWNEDNFDIGINDYVNYAYKHKKWAFVTDYVRMYVLFHYGGIYLDTDVELIKNLDELRYQYAYMGMEESGCINSGVGMGTVSQNPILKEILNIYDSISVSDIVGWGKWKVNAEWESGIFRKHGFIANNQYQVVENIAIFPSVFFSPVLVGKKEVDINNNTFSIHHYHYSWLDENKRAIIWEEKGNYYGE